MLYGIAQNVKTGSDTLNGLKCSGPKVIPIISDDYNCTHIVT